MFGEGSFNEKDLKLCDWQPHIIHNLIDFEVGDLVYLSCAPEMPMEIISIDYNAEYNNIQAKWYSMIGELQLASFSHWVLQLYNTDVMFRRYRRSEFVVCLN